MKEEDRNGKKPVACSVLSAQCSQDCLHCVKHKMSAEKQHWNEKKKMDSKKRLVENENKYDFMRAQKNHGKKQASEHPSPNSLLC